MGVESIKLLLTSDGADFYRDAYKNIFKKLNGSDYLCETPKWISQNTMYIWCTYTK